MSKADAGSADYMEDFVGQIDKSHLEIIGPCLDVFGEAVQCYKVGAYLAACVMCRDSVEAILYLAAIRPIGSGEIVWCGSFKLRKESKGKDIEELKKKVEEGKQLSKVEKTVLENCWLCVNDGCGGFNVYFHNLMRLNDLIDWAKEEHLFDGLESKVDCIEENGNFAAHLVQRIYQQYYKIKPVEPNDIPVEPDKISNFFTTIRITIDKGSAGQAILDTAEVIKQVACKKWPTS